MKRLLSAAVAMSALLALPACSKASEHLVDVEIRDMDRYRTLETYFERNQTYVAGRPGHRYSVVLQNQTGERVLAVLSVDGVNAISGQTAATSQTGYVLAPYQRMEIRGWRKSMQDVAQFRFTDLPDSYAARTGRPDNVGVIGVAVFRERQYRHYEEYEPDYGYRDDRYAPKAGEQSNQAGAAADSAAPAMKSRSSMAESQSRQELGTGHGERRYDPARQTTFERASSYPNQVSRIFYDSYEALVARGIIRDRWYRDRGRNGPDAFPIGFVPDPDAY